MRVLHVDPERGWGGGEVQVATLVGELTRRGHECIVVASPGSRLAAAARALGVRVEACAIRNHFDVRAVPRLRRLAREVDVVHFHTARAHAMAPWLGRTGPRRVVTRRMDYVPRGGPWVRFLYNHAVDCVIAISGGVRAALVSAGVDAARIRVVPSGVDVEAFTVADDARAVVRREWGVGADDVAVVALGVLEERKGHATLMEAATRIAADLPIHYVFCGTGSIEGRLRAAAALSRAPIHFAGFRRDVPACLAAADVVVLPSLHEGLGVAALEAMAAGRAVVASRVGGLAEVVEDRGTGLLVPAQDPGALAEALGVLARDRERRHAMGRRGLARVRARYSAAAMADGTLACYVERP
ncbi:MAG: glycosyltransferase [Candidatus Binatia bacterium]